MKKLTSQETEVMWLIAEGLTNEKIGQRMKLSKHTIKFHVFNALGKLDSRYRAQAAVRFVWMNLDEAQRRLKLPALPPVPSPPIEEHEQQLPA